MGEIMIIKISDPMPWSAIAESANFVIGVDVGAPGMDSCCVVKTWWDGASVRREFISGDEFFGQDHGDAK
jgi:hypothetical protein